MKLKLRLRSEASREGGFKKSVPLLLSLLFALTAAAIVYTMLASAQPSVPVVAASRTLSIGHVVESSDLKVVKLPPSVVPPNAVRDPAAVVGKVIFGGPVLAGDILRAEHLSEAGSLSSVLATLAPPGWVAVELPQNTALAMAGIRRGDRVDIYGETGSAQGTVVGKLAEGAVVLATPWVSAAGASGPEAKQYVVAVPPDKAPAIAAMTVMGRRATLVLPGQAKQ